VKSEGTGSQSGQTGKCGVMDDFDFVQEKLNYFFSDGVHRIAVIPKEDSSGNTDVSDVGKSAEKHAWESSKNGFTNDKSGSNLK
jgi:hypothetical protein